MIEDKLWYRSRTIWGGIVALGAALIGLFGVEIDAGTGADLASAVTDSVAAAGALIAIVGRIAAKATIA